LSAFTEQNKDLFFGREDFAEQLVTAVKRHPLVPVIGASGSGKSSVVFAGLIPRLRAEKTWLIGSFRPQSQPFYGLASALVRIRYSELNKNQQDEQTSNLFERMQENRKLWQEVTDILKEHPGKRLLLVVDQFEELYALDKQTQKQFVDALLEAIQFNSNLKLVLTIRHEFLDYIMNYPPFNEVALQPNGHKFLGTMNREEMKSVIELIDRSSQKPIVELQDGLTERILDEVQQEPGNLPLLEFALTQLWHKQSLGQLTHQAYSEIGGVAKALSNRAEVVYGNLSKEEQKQAQRIFLQLVRPGEGTEDTRRLATRAEVGEENWNLVQELAGESARLVVTGRNETTGEETVEVVHEALIREWQSLREWIENDRAFLTWRHQLRIDMERWRSADKDEGALLRGALLAEANGWLQQRLDELSSAERIFIEESKRFQEREAKSSRNFLQLLDTFGFTNLEKRVETKLQKLKYLQNDYDVLSRTEDELSQKIKALEKQIITTNNELNESIPLVFISYAKEDEDNADQLYQGLKERGLKPWMDKEDILPGQEWELQIRKAIDKCDFLIIMFSSSSVNKRGYLHKEIKMALTIAQEMPEDSIFLIPARLEKCVIPENMNKYQWVDLFSSNGLEKLIQAIITEWSRKS